MANNGSPDPNDSGGGGVTIKTPGGYTFHLGYSRIAAYLSCPLKYKFTYIDNIPYKTGAPLLRGTAYHAVVEKLLKYKTKYDGDMAEWEEVHPYALKQAGIVGLNPTDTKRLLEACQFYHSEMYPKHKPLVVEEAFTIVRGGVELTGRIDLIETSGKIIDHKFSYDIWAEPRAKYGVQPMIYQWAGLDAIKPKFNVDYGGFAYNIIKTYPAPVIQVINIPVISQAMSDWWEDQVASVAKAIDAGIFFAKPSAEECKWCSYTKHCNPAVYKIEIEQFGLGNAGDDC
jgi:hypothetical protein